LTACRLLERYANTTIFAFDCIHRLGKYATHPLARPVKHLAVSFLLAGPGLRRRRFVPGTRPNAPSGASNYRSQDHSSLRQVWSSLSNKRLASAGPQLPAA
jgi:hypothetical protein